MTIEKRTGFDWQCEAPGCDTSVQHMSDRTPPINFVEVTVKAPDLEGRRRSGHACSDKCAASLAQELYGMLIETHLEGGSDAAAGS